MNLASTPIPGRKVAVTGASGFVGKSLVAALKRLQVQVLPLDIQQGHDIRNWSTLKNFSLDRTEIVYHLAARLFIPHALDNPWPFYETNVLGTLNMLRLCQKYNVKKFIFMSSYVYGPPQILPTDEGHPLNPTNPYAITKLLGENLCRQFHEDFGLSVIIFRAFNIYGPGQQGFFLIPEIIQQMSEGKICLKDPNPKRDYLFITDLIEALLRAADYEKGSWEIFNLGSGESYSVKEIVETILQLAGRPNLPVTFAEESRPGEILDTRADYRRAQNLLNWGPTVPLILGLKHCLAARG
ncbi:NAD-dependent epimerase/dehydratase family protein [Desulfobacca acetoxidans]